MPVSKKRTTPQPDPTKEALAEHYLPEEQEFRQRLRALAVSAVRVLIEQVMREELDECVGAEWGECTPDGKATAMATTSVISSPAQGVSRIFPCPEIARGNFRHKSLSDIVGMNRK